MDVDAARRAYRLFSRLLYLDDRERAQFLGHACSGDSNLRDLVECLLAADSRAAGFLEPTGDVAATVPGATQHLPTRISHYRIRKRLGAGGMGEVYLADDTALGRQVALKVLPRGFSPLLSDRLAQEAKADARLQHPGIATFYEAGQVECQAFIAMEYVAGQTLRQRLKDGPLPWKEAIGVTDGLLQALGHAHSVGILHRDIKPENIMITEADSVKLLDFGIAKYMASEDNEINVSGTHYLSGLTGVSALPGTPGYMSPEQIRRQPLDARSDIFAVGAVLYEMLTGRRAFPGKSPLECVAAVISGEGPALPVADIPLKLNEALSRALSGEAVKRYRSASAFLSDLRTMKSEEAVSTMPNMLALMDFDNLSGERDDDWIGLGIVEILGAQLDCVPDLSLVRRSRVSQAIDRLVKSGNLPSPADVGLALGCRWIVSGGFRRTGAALQLTITVTEVSTGRVLLAEQMDGPFAQFFKMQDRLSSVVASGLRREAPRRQTAPQLDAYECYMRGRQLQERLEKGAADQAQELYERAVDLDASHAAALAGLATIHGLRFTYGADQNELSAAAGYGRRAVVADPRMAEAHVWLGYALWRQDKWVEAYEAEQTAIALDPQNSLSHYFAAAIMLSAYRYEEALIHCQRAYTAEPDNAWVLLVLGWTHLELGNASDACWCLERLAERERLGQRTNIIVGSEGCLAECLRRTGSLADARARALAGLEAVEASDFIYRDSFRGICLCVLGRTAIEQGDYEAARAAFRQAVLHHRGRPRALGGGHLLVQALAGLSRAGEGASPLEEALGVFEDRNLYNFSYLATCSEGVTLLELARAAKESGLARQSEELLERARRAGSTEAGPSPFLP